MTITQSAKHVVGAWTYATDNPKEAVALLRKPPFMDAPFLVERTYNHGAGCPCCTRIETQLGVYPGKWVAVMLNNPTRWKLKRYAVIETSDS